MNTIDNTIIDEVLLFLKGCSGKSPRYNFDQYITINIRVEQSFNIVPKQLLDEGLIVIKKEKSGTFIELTEKGNHHIDNFYKTVTSACAHIEAKFSSIENLSISKYLPFISVNDEKIHLKIKFQNESDQIIYHLRRTHTLGNQIISETKIYDQNKNGLDLLTKLIEFYYNLNNSL